MSEVENKKTNKGVWKDKEAQLEHLAKIRKMGMDKKQQNAREAREEADKIIAEKRIIAEQKKRKDVVKRVVENVVNESETESDEEGVVVVKKPKSKKKKKKKIIKKIIEVSSSSSSSESSDDEEDYKHRLKMKYKNKYKNKNVKTPQNIPETPKFEDAVNRHVKDAVEKMAWGSIFPNYKY